MEQELFDFDDFFVDNADKGMPEQVEMVDGKGRKRVVTIFVKRGLSLEDREASKSAATRTSVSPNGQLKVDGFDDGVFEVEVLTRCIKSWPFERFIYNESGDIVDRIPVPVTRANVAQLRHTVADSLVSIVQKLTTGPTEEALAPFEKPSAEVS